MKRTNATTTQSIEALNFAESMQKYFANTLKGLAESLSAVEGFHPVEWFRDGGRHGGGLRLVATSGGLFNRASINVSQVQYEDMPEKKLNAATALSTIIHPSNPYAPSIHMHISWTELKSGQGSWRVMADLNPSIASDSMKHKFDSALQLAAGKNYKRGKEDGEKYFFIPSLGRHRGLSHFYLEGYNSGDYSADKLFAKEFFESMVRCYTEILGDQIRQYNSFDETARRKQLDYHSLYFLQVLTLDRGTTSGLLIHSDNDVGVLGSIPAYVSKKTLSEWVSKQQAPQDKLLQSLIAVLGDNDKVAVGDEEKKSLCEVVRAFYKEHPEALKMQAAGSIIPPTVSNHK